MKKLFITKQRNGSSIWDTAMRAFDSYYGGDDRLQIDSFDRNGWNEGDDEFENSPIDRTWLVMYMSAEEYKASQIKSAKNGGEYQYGFVNDTEELYVFLKEVFSMD